MNYEDLQNATWEEIPEAKLLPGGQWLLKGRNVGYMKPKKEGDSAKVLFFYKAKEPVSVNAEDLEELGADYDLDINDLTYTVYIESAADWDKVRKHVAQLGIELSGALFDDKGKLRVSKEFKDAEVVATVGQRSYENDAGETIWQNNLSGFQKVEE